MIKDYYEILTLKRDSSVSQIAQQYKRLVLRWHPRFAKEDQKTAHYHFSQISEAYQVLSDPLKRSYYDRHGYLKLKQGLFSEGELKGGYRFADNPDEIFQKFYHVHNPLAKSVHSDIIEKGSLFGHSFGGLKYKQNNEIEDLVVEVHCNLHQLYLGVSKKVIYQKRVLNLDGRTTSFKSEQRLLEIKPGYGAETHLLFKGEGHDSVNRHSSDLIFKIVEQKHQKYIRKGADLIYTKDIELADALNCQSLEITTLDNRRLHISIDQIVNPSTIKEIIGQGMPSQGLVKGNLYIHFNILFPRQLAQERKDELHKLLS